jgi:hypothetical protein
MAGHVEVPGAAAGGVDIQQLLQSRSRIRLKDGRKLCFTFYGHPRNSPRPPTKILLYFHGWYVHLASCFLIQKTTGIYAIAASNLG